MFFFDIKHICDQYLNSLIKNISIVFVLFVLLFVSQTKAEGLPIKNIPAKSYNSKSGLANDNVQHLIQDDEGFIWVGTKNGLSRYDSSKFVNYFKDKSDPDSLPEPYIEQVMSMPDNKIWLSVSSVGITIFDKFTKTFSSNVNRDSDLFKLPNSNLFGMDNDQSGNVWFSLYGEGVYMWDTQKQTFTKHLPSNENAWLTSNKTYELLIDSRNRLWVSTVDAKVFLYEIDTGSSKVFDFYMGQEFGDVTPIYGFTESPAGEIYAGGFPGAFKYNETTKEFDVLISKASLSKYHDNTATSVRRIMIDRHNNIWIGTTSSLVLFTNNNLYKVQLFENGEKIRLQGTVNGLVEGDDGNIWVGTEDSGVVKLASDWNRYNIYFPTQVADEQSYVTTQRAFVSDKKLWIGEFPQKVELYEFFSNELKFVNSYYSDRSKESAKIDAIFADKEEIGFLWVSTVSGVDKINLETSEVFSVIEMSGKRLDSARNLYRDTESNRFYFNLFDEETLGYFDKDEMIARLIPNKETNQLKGNIVNQLDKGIGETLWLATTYGIEALDLNTLQIKEVYRDSAGHQITGFYIESNEKNVWAIINGSLELLIWDGVKLSASNQSYSHILPTVSLYQIKSIKDDVMLIRTLDSGVVEMDIKTKSYSVYTTENGLPSNAIVDILSVDGTPVIVTEKGIAVYNSSFQKQTPNKPNLIIDDIKYNQTQINLNDALILDYNYGALSIDATLLSYTSSSSVEYQYLLEGLNKQWISTGNDGKYSFLNLASGDYNFKVRGRGNYGAWSDPKEFSFKVNPPPWKTTWAYMLYLLALLSIVFTAVYLYRRKLLYENEIVRQQTQKQLADDASKAKSEFLARVSHEIRPPLNGVLGMSELLLSTEMNDEQNIYAETIITSGKHLLDIINDILDLSKIEAGKLELEEAPLNLLSLIDEIANAFSSQAKQKNIVFTCCVSHNLDIKRSGDLVRIKQIFFNLLSNAFKFTEKGEINLFVQSDEDNPNVIVFRLVDTGIGINAELIENLFNPFVQADSSITRKYGGTGLGLAIVKQLVEKMNGEISLESDVNKGSVFTVKLMMNKVDALEETLLPQINKHSCLAINNNNIKLCLQEYLQFCGVTFSETIVSTMDILFVDCVSKLTDSQSAGLLEACEKLTPVCLIGYNSEYIDTELLNKLKSCQLLFLPLTHDKVLSVFQPQQTTEKTFYNSIQPVGVSYKILVVEDDLVNQQVSIEMLEKMNHLVDVVDNVDEALVMLQRNSYDLLLTDYHLPGKDGLELVSLWDNPQKIPILVITADLTDEVLIRCNKQGIDEIVTKPFTKKQLTNAISLAFKKRL